MTLRQAKSSATFVVVGIEYNSVDYLFILDAYPKLGAKALTRSAKPIETADLLKKA